MRCTRKRRVDQNIWNMTRKNPPVQTFSFSWETNKQLQRTNKGGWGQDLILIGLSYKKEVFLKKKLEGNIIQNMQIYPALRELRQEACSLVGGQSRLWGRYRSILCIVKHCLKTKAYEWAKQQQDLWIYTNKWRLLKKK